MPLIVAPDKRGRKNPNWKGGISCFKTADELLSLSSLAREEVMRRLLRSIRKKGEDSCWDWLGLKFSNGRARLSIGKNSHLAYRLFYVLLSNKKIGRKLITHSCDNPGCMNPRHFVIGTSSSNSSDMVAKRRSAWGDKNNGAKLTENQAREVKRRILAGESGVLVASDFGIHPESARRIARGSNWKWL
jgi:hypothetical protein